MLSDLIPSRLNGKPLLLANYPTSAVEGGEPSVIIAGLNVDWMARLMSNLGERPGVEAVLIDGKGTVLAAQPNGQDIAGRPYKGIEPQAVEGTDVGSTSVMVNGVRKFITFVRLSGTDARLLVTIDHDAMLAPINRDIQKAYVQLAFISLLALLGAWLVGEQFIIRPIRTMTSMANRFGRGDLSARATADTLPAEFKPLASAFNGMAAQLAERERDLIANNDRLTVMASVDMVSGLANRRGFQSRLEFEWLKMQQVDGRLALMMIDVDHFKLFNDSYGHPEGDACLGRVGETLARIANETQGFAARYGGEEFCLVLPGVDGARAVEVGEIIREAVAGLSIPHIMSEHGHVTVSVGVCMVTPNAEQLPAELIEAADAALYAAKRQGRNQVVEHGLARPGAPAVSMVG